MMNCPILYLISLLFLLCASVASVVSFFGEDPHAGKRVSIKGAVGYNQRHLAPAPSTTAYNSATQSAPSSGTRSPVAAMSAHPKITAGVTWEENHHRELACSQLQAPPAPPLPLIRGRALGVRGSDRAIASHQFPQQGDPVMSEHDFKPGDIVAYNRRGWGTGTVKASTRQLTILSEAQAPRSAPSTLKKNGYAPPRPPRTCACPQDQACHLASSLNELAEEAIKGELGHLSRGSVHGDAAERQLSSGGRAEPTVHSEKPGSRPPSAGADGSATDLTAQGPS